MVLTLHAATAGGESRLVLDSAAGQAGPFNWQSARVTIVPLQDSEIATQWQFEVDGLALGGWRGSVSVDCARGGLRGARPWCARGQFEWRWGDEGGRLAGRLSEPDDGPGLAFELRDLGLSGELQWLDGAENALPEATVRLAGFDLASLPAALLDSVGLSVLEGRVNGLVEFSGGQLASELKLDGVEFDRSDGTIAGAGLSVALRGRISGMLEGQAAEFSLSVVQSTGELLAGPVYLPPPEEPLEIDLVGKLRPGSGLRVDSLVFNDGGVVEASGGLALEAGADGWQLAEFNLDHVRLAFPGAWRRWGEGPASARGFGDLVTEGVLAGSMAWRSGRLELLSLQFKDVGVRDGADRFALDSVDGRLERTTERLEANLEWEGLDVFSLAFGSSQLDAAGAPDDWRLTRALRLPLLDGAVVVDRLEVSEDPSGAPSLALDTRIEPLDLVELTRMLGFPTFGGQLSGNFPGVRVSGQQIAFAGGIDVQAFSGGIRLSDLVIERPFGSLPALAAQVEIGRLDLAELTGAFNFGHMEGELSGWMRDLRLLDWQPVAMDARLYTHDDAARRRISQRAVENLSRLGGGAAAIGVTVLRMFEEFPYRRAGLACRLDRNICHIDGVAPHDSGGFYIVEGRGLPHLDVVGHRRLVDWPQLVAQLVAMTKG